MATIKVCTSIEQSRKLANILPPDSSDTFWWEAEGKEYVYVGKCSDNNSIPAWSVSALLEQMPTNILIEKYIYDGTARYYITKYTPKVGVNPYNTGHYNNLVDACVDMIIELHEQNLL